MLKTIFSIVLIFISISISALTQTELEDFKAKS